jgi:hypothetical protein
MLASLSWQEPVLGLGHAGASRMQAISLAATAVCHSGVTGMVRPRDSKYDAYVRHRILHAVLELFPRYGNWEAMAAAVSQDRGIEFYRTYFNRLRDGTIGDHVLDSLVGWLTSLDRDFPLKLRPETIFSDVGVSARDYYFHLFGMADLEEWDESLLAAFEGVYLCAPADDPHTYLPLPYIRACMNKEVDVPKEWRAHRSMDLKYYISKRSYLILKRTGAHYYHAAEIPMGALFPPELDTLDIRSFHEGVGIASSNTIHVFLRECLTRTPKIHSIIIRPKESHVMKDLAGLELYVPPDMRMIEEEWKTLSAEHVVHMRAEFAEQIDADVFITGTSQVNVSPLPLRRNFVETVFGTENVYHRKPVNFLKGPETHFIRPDFDLKPQLEKLVDNPLMVGELL